ncbi:MAG: Eco57I restriction-modification methylase domain-containing protein [Myxococcota bacterium]
MPFPVAQVRDRLSRFDFAALFVEELGWNRSPDRVERAFEVGQQTYGRKAIAELGGVVVIEVTAADRQVPIAAIRKAIHKHLSTLHHEHLLIFLGRDRHESLWSWQKREAGKAIPREHLFVREQPADLFLTKLADLVFEVTDFGPDGLVSVTEVSSRLRNALDVQTVTRQFFREFQEQHASFVDLIQGIADARERHWYASVLLHRLMFVWFLQKKGFVDGCKYDYLPDKLAASKAAGTDQFFRGFLGDLFFQGFALPEEKRTPEVRERIGRIRYLNGGLFLPHAIETRHCFGPQAADVADLGEVLQVPDLAFDGLFALFERYTWALDDTPGGDARGVNPDVLGYIFEKYINQKSFGAYYTRPEITEYLCERTIHQLILDAVNDPADAVLPPGVRRRRFDTVADLLLGLDAALCRKLLIKETGGVLPGLSLLDPACGSGAFLVAAMKTLVNIYSAALGRIDFLGDKPLTDWKTSILRQHKSVHYFIKKAIITDNLYGVDVMEEATEIAKLRLFLSLVASAESEEQLEPLPNIDFNVLAGNSLIGLLRVSDREYAEHRSGYQGNLFAASYKTVLADKNRKVEAYRHNAVKLGGDLTAVRNAIDAAKVDAYRTLDRILLDEFTKKAIKFEQATWDVAAGKEGKPKKRTVTLSDIRDLRPLHWGFDFDEVMNDRGGFDAILTNPPWEVWQTDEKEFFQAGNGAAARLKKLRLEDWKARRTEYMRDPDVCRAWLTYASRFPHVSAWFKSSDDFCMQKVFRVNGTRAPTKINLCNAFLERTLSLLRPGGRLGLVSAGGILNDLAGRTLRDFMFERTTLDPFIALSNERDAFEGVHHDFRFCLVSLAKRGSTAVVRTRFRVTVAEALRPDQLGDFLSRSDDAVELPVAVIRELSPETLAIMDFRQTSELVAAMRIARFPRLSDWSCEDLHFKLGTDLNMTTDGPFESQPAANRLPLQEGKTLHQYDPYFAHPTNWFSEGRLREKASSKRAADAKKLARVHGLRWSGNTAAMRFDHEEFRLAFRDVGPQTNERSMIAAILPPGVACPHTTSVELVYQPVVVRSTLPIDLNAQVLSAKDRLYLCAIFNSFVADYWLRRSLTKHLSFMHVYNLPVPRLPAGDPGMEAVVHRAARLTCTTPSFDDLARAAGLRDHRDGARDPDDRARLRAELDGLVAHLYGLTAEEFAYVLGTFPLVPAPVTLAAANAWRDVAQGRLP